MILHLASLHIKDAKRAGRKAAMLGELIRAGYTVPPGFVVPVGAKLDKEAIMQAVSELNAKKLAVRSSAVGEDGARHSHAGEFLTVLNVAPKDVVAAIKKVRASGPRMAVIVQEMIAGDTSGVAFSVHPVTGNRNELVIESVKGLGEKLVSGKVTPTTKVINKKSKLTGLAKLVVQIEKQFGYPVDIEWTRKGKTVYILQSRPITTL